MYSEKEIFSRTELLLGKDVMQRLGELKVVLFGVGGVGGWCAESLIRSGIRHLTIVDSDCVSATNINRQLPATIETVGQSKVEVLKNRLQTINPQAEITAINEPYSDERHEYFRLYAYNYIIDAIDTLEHKAALILRATQESATLISSMGAALKVDSSRIRTSEFWKVQGCPLAAALRRRFKRNGKMPAKKFECVFSDEVFANRGVIGKNDADVSQWDREKVCFNGTIVYTTAIFGFKLSEILIKDVLKHLPD